MGFAEIANSLSFSREVAKIATKKKVTVGAYSAMKKRS